MMTDNGSNDRFLLTIAVPTYKRLRYLMELLPRLLAECRICDGAVQLLVVDNDSNDGTEEYVRSVFAESRFCRYVKNSENIGGDRNFLRCIELADGKYVWLFGDDELLGDNAPRRIVSMLNDHQPGIIISTHRLKRTKLYSSYRKALAGSLPWHWSFVLHQTLITANVFKKDSFDLPFAYSMLPTSYAHIYGLRPVFLSPTTKTLVLSGRRRLYSVRLQRAEFAVTPTNLEKKLENLLSWISRESGSKLLGYYSILFFRILNPIKGWSMAWLRKLKRFSILLSIRTHFREKLSW